MNRAWDVIVIGAGAAGLMAAFSAASRGHRTLLLEKNRKLGVKILMSGGTRCNVTHDTDWAAIAEAFGQQGRFLKHSLASFSPDQVVAFFHAHGVPTKVESTGKIFPRSDRAIDVRDALVRAVEAAGAAIVGQTPVTAIEKLGSQFQISTDDRTFVCQKVIVTTGGQSYPGCGTTGDAYRWMADFGHSIAAPRPALVPLKVNLPWVRELTGMTLEDVAVKFDSPLGQTDNRARSRYRGSFLFTHFGCSGPVVLNISRCITNPSDTRSKSILCDWLPNQTRDELANELASNRETSGHRSVVDWISDKLPNRLSTTMARLDDLSTATRLSELSRTKTQGLLDRLKRSELPVSGTRGFVKAEVTAGGAVLDEVNARTMESKRVPGLFIAGELLDVDGPIGGYNFQAAFSTGWLAGQSV